MLKGTRLLRLVAAAGLLACAPSAAFAGGETMPVGQPAANVRYVIHAGHLIATPGRPTLTNKSIIVENGKVVAIEDGFLEGGKIIDLSRSWVLPGLINMHTHMALPSFDRMVTWRLLRQDVVALEALPKLKAMLEAGFTTIRDLGDDSSTMYELTKAINKGTIAGPRILASEQFMGIGNGYFTDYGVGFRPELAPLFVSRGQCTTREACRDAVRDEVKRGAQVIKIRLSFLPLADKRVDSVETVEELKWIVDMAHQLKRTVAIHTVVGKTFQAATNAILAGADTIEHGPLSAAEVKLMKERGTGYVPTLAVAKSSAGTYPGLYERIRAGSELAVKAGVPMGYGTDFPLVSIEDSAREFLEMQAIGLTSSQALMTATVNAAKMLDRADEIGSIAPGMMADIIAVDSDPLQDMTVLGKIAFVMKDGMVVKAQ